MEHALNFAKKYNGWHSYSNDRITRNAIKKLAKLKLIRINKYDQFTIN